ncbi:MAG: asparaginase [Porphyromonadaceae bacterium]|nr:asparaginase [Porphyromonadaceae bacterium]
MCGNATSTSILLIYTGGTIGMVENPDTGALEPLDFAYLYDNIPEMKRLDCQIDIKQVDPPIDSSTISIGNWVNMASLIKLHYDDYDGFVILHGTDTMSYSASALSFMLQGIRKPVVFTGSQLPIGRLRTDGKENLLTAIEIAAAKREDGSARVPEVSIFFQDYLMRGNRTSKVSADKFRAFKSHNYPQLAFAGIDIHYNEGVIHRDARHRRLEVSFALDPNVTILKLFPGITRPVVEAILRVPNLKGVILETFGSGNAPKFEWFTECLAEATVRGIVIVNVTQCSSGMVDMSRYETGRQLHSAGVVCGYDMTTESAVTKMMYLLGQELPVERVRELMETPLRGEMSLSLDHEDFYCWRR